MYAGHQNTTNLSGPSSPSDLAKFEGMRTGITQDIATNPSSLYSVLVMMGSPYALLSLPSSPVLMATVYGETANHSLSSNISMDCFACPASLRRLLVTHPPPL